jgi:RNase P subunit RPR2
MRLCAKSIYCPQCRELVRGLEQQDEVDPHRTNIVCSKCGRPLHVGNGVTWRYVRQPV